MFDLNKTSESLYNVNNIIKEDEDDILLEDVFNNIPFTWWIKEIDNTIWLLWWNKLVIYAWEAWSWKTTASLQQWIENAKNGKKVCYMSLEMWRRGLIICTASKLAWITIQTTLNKQIEPTENQKAIFMKEVNRLQNDINIVWYKESLWIESFKRELLELTTKYELIIIDNIWMIWRKDWEKEIDLLPKITNILMRARNEKNTTIIALHHTNKWRDDQTWPRGKNSIRGSGKIVDDADKVVMIHRDLHNNTSFHLLKDRDNWLIVNMWLFYKDWIFTWDVTI